MITEPGDEGPGAHTSLVYIMRSHIICLHYGPGRISLAESECEGFHSYNCTPLIIVLTGVSAGLTLAYPKVALPGHDIHIPF